MNGPGEVYNLQMQQQPNGVTSNRCYVGNLSWGTSWQDLKDHFRKAGKVVHAKTIEEGGRSKGFGIVEYETVNEAANAISTLNGSTLAGRRIVVREDAQDRHISSRVVKRTVEPSGPAVKRPRALSGDEGSKRVYVGNLAWSVGWKELKDHFKKVGQVAYANVELDDTGRSRGWGIVEFENPGQDAARAIKQYNETDLNGRRIVVREDKDEKVPVSSSWPTQQPKAFQGGYQQFSEQPQQFQLQLPQGDPVVKLQPEPQRETMTIVVAKRCYVGNLAWGVSWQDLKDHFRQSGNVVYTNVLEHGGRSKGCGVVEYEKPDEAARAITDLNDTEIKGRKIFVREDREDRELKEHARGR